MKYTVKFLILLGIFIASIYFFGSNMDEAMFGTTKTEVMGEAELPTIALLSDNVTVNCLYGYTTPIDMFSIRENMVAIGADHTIELLLEENKTNVRKLQYEVVDVATRKQVAEGTVIAFDKEGEQKKARIKVSGELESGQEYAVEVMLVDSESRRIYYYFRMKYYEDCGFAEKVALMHNFSDWAREKNEEAVKPFMESTYKGEGTTYARVDIKDSIYMACWGDLEPKLLTEPRITISEIYSNMAVGTLDYMVELETASGAEQYYVKEKFRVKTTATSQHLLNYERTMESVFDEQLSSLSQNQFKLGITNETDIELLTNSDASMLVFVRNKELWQYNMAENKLSRVFSYRDANEAENGLSCDQYGIRVLKLYENGDISFMVYGYMGRGEYEGRTGIMLYRYYRSEERIEEQLYLPVSESYQKIKEELGEFSYMNEYDVFYFMVYDTMYSYNLITRGLTVISDNAVDEYVLFFRDSSFVAWQEADYKSLKILHLETGKTQEIVAPEGEFIRILGRINDNIICSYGLFSDCVTQKDGTMLYPAYQVKILDGTLKERKSYQKEDVYISGAELTTSSICLHRVIKTESGEYKEIEDDYILNSTEAVKKAAKLDYRITEKMFIEYYIDLPSAYAMKEIPVPEDVPYTLISEDTTVRISKLENEAEEYMVYSFGEIAAITEDCAEAILLADLQDVVGTVINEDGRVVWERGVKYTNFALKELEKVSLKESGLTSRQEAVRMLAAYMDQVVDTSVLLPEQDIKTFLEEATGNRVISLNGATLEEVLHFVFRGTPVLAMENEEEALVITGYTANSITVYDPSGGRYRTYSKEEAEKMFSKMGNMFISYVK